MALDQVQADYIKAQNEKEAAERAGKPPEPRPTPALPAPVIVEDNDDDEPAKGSTPDPGRSQRRRENRLRETAAEERGRRQALEELLAKGFLPPVEEKKAAQPKPEEDPEPKRENFPDDAAYYRALGFWEGKRGATEVIKKVTKEGQEAAAYGEWLDRVSEADTKYKEDVKLIPNFDEMSKAADQAAADDPTLRTDFMKRDVGLYSLIMESDVRAFMLHHFAEKPDDLRKILALNVGPQRDMFKRLEGRVEKLYSTEQRENVSDKKVPPKQETAAERDAKKPKPSEAGAPRGGSAPATTVKPYLEDGRTINPAWKALQNEREGLRR